jgi:hypothetical protein
MGAIWAIMLFVTAIPATIVLLFGLPLALAVALPALVYRSFPQLHSDGWILVGVVVILVLAALFVQLQITAFSALSRRITRRYRRALDRLPEIAIDTAPRRSLKARALRAWAKTLLTIIGIPLYIGALILVCFILLAVFALGLSLPYHLHGLIGRPIRRPSGERSRFDRRSCRRSTGDPVPCFA